MLFSTMKVEEWLSSSRDYLKGLDILERAKVNSAILRLLQKGPSYYNTQRMAKEIEKLSQSAIIPDTKKTAAEKPVPSKVNNWDGVIPNERLPESLSKVLKAIKEYYAIVNHFHPLLDATYNLDKKKAFEIKLALQDAWEEIELCWRIINYWKAHNEVLPSKYTKSSLAMETLDPTELIKRRNNLRTYISKHKENPRKAVKVGQWEKELQRIEALIPE